MSQDTNTIAYNKVTLADLMDQTIQEVLLTLNAHHIGTIQSFNATSQTAEITINYTMEFNQFNPVTKIYDTITREYPVLGNCPVICLGGGLTNLTFPIKAGDECLVLFNDRDFTNWMGPNANASTVNGPKVSQTGVPPLSDRLHAISDGIAIVGLRSFTSALSGYSTTHAMLSYGTTQLGVSATQARIANGTTTLNTVLQNLVTNIETLNTTLNTFMGVLAALTPPSTPVVNSVLAAPGLAAQTALTTLATSLATTATQISGLLE